MDIRIIEFNKTNHIEYNKKPSEKDFITLEELNNDKIIFNGSKSSLLFTEELANRFLEQRRYKYGDRDDQIVFLEEILRNIFFIDIELDKPYYYEVGERIEFDWELVGLKGRTVFITPAYIIRFHPTHY